MVYHVYRLVVLSVLILLTFSGCSKERVEASQAELLTSIDEKALDRSVSPCADFYQFSCGNWIKRTQLPPGYSRWTRFNELADSNLMTLKGILEGFASLPDSDVSGKQLGDFYGSCMDDTSLRGSELTLNSALSDISAIETRELLLASLASLHHSGMSVFFEMNSTIDENDSSRYIGLMDRAGMGLPDRSYYFPDSESGRKLLESYRSTMIRLMTLSGVPKDEAASSAQNVVALETKLAEKAMELAERRDPTRIYHLMSLSDLKSLVPEISWATYGAQLGLKGNSPVNVREPDFLKRVGEVLRDAELETLKDYMKWHLILDSAPYLSSAFEVAHFEFFGKALQGSKEQLPRWKRCVNTTSVALGEALGAHFVKLKFGDDAKAGMKALLGHLRDAVNDNFTAVDWMDEATREQARLKLASLGEKVGHPSQFLDYSSVKVSRESYLANIRSSKAFEMNRALKKVGQPVDLGEWEMTPQTVNAYFHPNRNEIVFPAAILQHPFYSVKAPIASSYGGIGMVIGHEITHAFDDEGRHYDAAGNLRNWWSDAATTKFKDRAQCVVDQYGSYTVADGVPINGQLTLGENIADLGGVKLSFAAFKKALSESPGEPAVFGLSPEQQFFVSFAQIWCSKQTPELEKLRAKTDPHSPAKYRVQGVVINLPEFSEVFECRKGAPMNPEKKCSVW